MGHMISLKAERKKIDLFSTLLLKKQAVHIFTQTLSDLEGSHATFRVGKPETRALPLPGLQPTRCWRVVESTSVSASQRSASERGGPQTLQRRQFGIDRRRSQVIGYQVFLAAIPPL